MVNEDFKKGRAWYGGVSVIFEESLRVMSVPVTLGGPDAYTNGTQM